MWIFGLKGLISCAYNQGLHSCYFFPTILHPQPKFWQIPLSGWQLNPVSRQRNYLYSQILCCILVKSWMPRIPFQTLYNLRRFPLHSKIFAKQKHYVPFANSNAQRRPFLGGI